MKSRKKLRLKDFDYASNYISLITLRVVNGLEILSVIKDSVELTKEGEVLNKQIIWLEERYGYITIHSYVIMPTHVHLLLEIDDKKALPDQKIKSVSELIGALKTTSCKQIRLSINPLFQWHKSFHDRIVRDDVAYQMILNYIEENPKRWKEKKEADGYNR